MGKLVQCRDSKQEVGLTVRICTGSYTDQGRYGGRKSAYMFRCVENVVWECINEVKLSVEK